MSPRNRRQRSPRAILERLVACPPPRVRDRTLDAVDPDATVDAPSPRSATVEVTCWTPVDAAPSVEREPRATLLAEPPLSDGTNDAVVHTLVLEVDEPTRSVAVDYRSLDAAVLPERGVRVRTDDGESVAVAEAGVDDDQFRVTLVDPPTDGALFVEYAVTRNPAGGRHTVDVTVDGERETEARLVVVG